MKFAINKYAVILLSALSVTPLLAQAQPPDQPDYWQDQGQRGWRQRERPSYGIAANRLRLALTYLDNRDDPAVMRDQRRARREINAALSTLNSAAYQYGARELRRQWPHEEPDDVDRLERALDLLGRARSDVLQGESKPFPRYVQRNIVYHIDMATRAVQHAISIS